MASKKRQQDWKSHGDYMSAKTRKLDEQFAVKPADRDKDIFKGVSIFINGYTNPPSDELRSLVCSHGGKFQQYYSRSSVTHIVATNLPDSKIIEIRDKKIVRPQWILDSIEQSHLLPIESYLLYDGRQARQKQLNFGKIPDSNSITAKQSSNSSWSTNKSYKYDHTDTTPSDTKACYDNKDDNLSRTFEVSTSDIFPSNDEMYNLPKDKISDSDNIDNKKSSRQLEAPSSLVIVSANDEKYKILDLSNKVKDQMEQSLTERTAVQNSKERLHYSAENKRSGLQLHSDGIEQLILASKMSCVQSNERLHGQSKRNIHDIDMAMHGNEVSTTDMSVNEHEQSDSKITSVQEKDSLHNRTENNSGDDTNRADQKTRMSAIDKLANQIDQSSVSNRMTMSKNITLHNTTEGDDGNNTANQMKESPISDKSVNQTDQSSLSNKMTVNRNISSHNTTDSDDGNDTANQRKESPIQDKTANHKPVKAGDAKFVNEFYSNSRLHYLSTWGAELKQFSSELIKTRVNEGVVPHKYPAPGYHGRVIMHVDMDCFFVSVGLRCRPDLVGKPVAVCHAGKNNTGKDAHVHVDNSSNFTSMSEIASCSYEARKTGVKNGMFLGAARKLCPDIVCIPYHFQEYRTVSRQLYQILVNHTHDVEAVSCDEAYIDVSLILNETTSPIDLAKQIRHEINQQTQCTASIGIGHNVLIARLCTRKAKPDGQYHVHGQHMVQEFIAQQKVSDLPGVGYSMKEKLKAMDVTSCADLQRVSLQSLQEALGEKTGLMVFRYGRGEDDRPLRTERERKSVSAEINYGIRFTKESEPLDFINELAHEVQKRLKDIDSKGQSVTLKLKVRKKGAPEPRKYMGHGICDNIARSTSLPTPTDDAKTIATKCHLLLRQLKILPSDIRGMGIQVNKLTQHKPNTRTLFDFTTKGTQRKTVAQESEPRASTCNSPYVTAKGAQRKTVAQESVPRASTCNSPYVTAKCAQRKTITQERHDDVPCSSPCSSPTNSFYSGDDSATPKPRSTTALTMQEALDRNVNFPPLPKFSPSPPSLPKQRRVPVAGSSRQQDEALSPSLRCFEQMGIEDQNKVVSPTSQGMGFEELVLPSPSQIDASALEALPREIRLSIQRQYAKRNTKVMFMIDDKEDDLICQTRKEGYGQLEKGTEDKQLQEQANLHGATTCCDVKTVLKLWTESSDLFQEDVDVVVEYFLKLVEYDSLEQLWILIKYLMRCITKTRSKAWSLACEDIIGRVQVSVIGKHGAPLAV